MFFHVGDTSFDWKPLVTKQMRGGWRVGGTVAEGGEEGSQEVYGRWHGRRKGEKRNSQSAINRLDLSGKRIFRCVSAGIAEQIKICNHGNCSKKAYLLFISWPWRSLMNSDRTARWVPLEIQNSRGIVVSFSKISSYKISFSFKGAMSRYFSIFVTSKKCLPINWIPKIMV